MAYALVGSRGAAVQAAASTALTTWAWGTSENRTANNLLIATVTVTGSATLPTTPSGWTIAKQVAGTSCSATIYEKIAAGADGVPTIGAITSGLIAGQLSEYSGNATTTPVDQSGSSTGTSSPNTATAGGVNAATGELIIMCAADRRSTARASNDTWTSNDGTVTLAGSNNGTSSTDHFSFGAIVGSTATTAQTSVVTLSVTTSITGIANVNASFKLASGGPVTVPQTVAVTTVTTLKMVRQAGKALKVTETPTPGLPKIVGKMMTATMTSSGAHLTRLVSLAGLVLTTTTVAIMQRSVGKAVGLNEAPTPGVVRSVTRTLAASVTPLVTLIGQITGPAITTVTLAVTSTLSAVLLTVGRVWRPIPAPTGLDGSGVVGAEQPPPVGIER